MKTEIKRALPLTGSTFLQALVNSPVFGRQLRVGKMIDESTAEIPHILTRATTEENVNYSGDTPVKPGTRVVIYNIT